MSFLGLPKNLGLGRAPTIVSFQVSPNAVAACQEHAVNHNIEGLLKTWFEIWFSVNFQMSQKKT